ncbi:unnamed protein product [Cuscuta epithymum]|uniref:CW-type domain-containing protein n=1 Tax=Cuscuta epithymum TaxID=186058 RepID=A0AAV0DH81_9ASTE|nr:unnamed protein product [Cuscuta epithymum]
MLHVRPTFVQMAHNGFKEEPANEDGPEQYVMLMKDNKTISRAQCKDQPGNLGGVWDIKTTVRQSALEFLPGSQCFFLYCDPQNDFQKNEWGKFMSFLHKNERVAVCRYGIYELYVLSPLHSSDFTRTAVAYRAVGNPLLNDIQMHHAVARVPLKSRDQIVNDYNKPIDTRQPKFESGKSCTQSRHNSSGEAAISCSGAVVNSKSRSPEIKDKGSSVKNYVRTDPSFLKTLGHTHSGWVFGAIAELVDNSRDAKATKFEISVGLVYLKSIGEEIPMLSVVDDGCGMNHQEILKMISFGHQQPEEDDTDRIGRFGIGFKTGAMALGKDALVLTQTTHSRSIAFLSQSLNEGKDNLEIPIISYRKTGQLMELDTEIQDESLAKSSLKTIKKFSPFDKYFIGEKLGLFSEQGTGTQIFIWNLEKWGSNYTLGWNHGMSGGSSFHQGDIFVRNKRIRTRPGQMTQMVPLDYSLRSYLQVIFLNPRMKIYVQGAQVKSCPLARSLNKTVVESGIILGRPVQLTLGRSQIEWENGNCGIFLYWHGRLIEAYKRVGSMIHNGDNGRGIIGVIEVEAVMNDDSGRVLVHNNKQGFLDCEAYVKLERWLGETVDNYIDKYVDKVELRKGGRLYKPDHEWVQCNKCRKWRVLPSAFDVRLLPLDWFCYMKPFNGKCEIPEQSVGDGVITVSSKRSHHTAKEDLVDFHQEQFTKGTAASKESSRILEAEQATSQAVDSGDELLISKRVRRSRSRSCRKA